MDTTGQRRLFAYGGVAFEILSDRTLAPMDDVHDPYVTPPDREPVLGHVRCALLEQGGPSSSDPRVSCVWDGEQGRVSSRALTARLLRIGRARYAATACSAGAPLSALVTSLAGAILSREGGLLLHAAGVAFGERALLFIGPSGSGKSTAARLYDGASPFARDRVAIVPSSAGFHAWSIAGGEPEPGEPMPARVCLPLAGVLRVRRGPRVAITALDGAARLSALVAASFSASDDAAAEGARLDAATRVASRVPVATLHTELGVPVAGAIARWLEEAG